MSSADAVIDETMMESRRCILLPKYLIVFVLKVRLSFFVAAAVRKEMCIQYLTWFPSLLALPHIIQSGYIGRNM